MSLKVCINVVYFHFCFGTAIETCDFLASPHATPQNGANSYTAATGNSKYIESAIWTIDDAGVLSAQWVNTNGCTSNLPLFPLFLAYGATSALPATILVYVPSADSFALVGDVDAFEETFYQAPISVSISLAPVAFCGLKNLFIWLDIQCRTRLNPWLKPHEWLFLRAPLHSTSCFSLVLVLQVTSRIPFLVTGLGFLDLDRLLRGNCFGYISPEISGVVVAPGQEQSEMY